jgi:hypothetical protein
VTYRIERQEKGECQGQDILDYESAEQGMAEIFADLPAHGGYQGHKESVAPDCMLSRDKDNQRQQNEAECNREAGLKGCCKRHDSRRGNEKDTK